MPRIKFLMTVLVISCLLLNSGTVFAGTLDIDDSPGIEQIISQKDQEIMNKFDNAKQWIQKQEELLTQFLAENFTSLRQKMEEAFQNLRTKFNEFREKSLNKNYTLVQEHSLKNPLPTRGFF